MSEETDETTSESLFTQGQEFNVQAKVITKLLDKSDLETKTDLDKPLKWVALASLQTYMKDNKLPKCSEILSNFATNAYRLLISKNRQGRKEFIEALQALSYQPTPENQPVSPLNTLGR